MLDSKGLSLLHPTWKPRSEETFRHSCRKTASLLHDVDTIMVHDSGNLIKNVETILWVGLWVENLELSVKETT